MTTKRSDAIERRADRLMRMVDDFLGEPSTKWLNDARIEILGGLLERIELAIAEAKERTF